MPYRCGLCRASCPNEYSLRQHEAGKKHLRRVALRKECVVAKVVSGDEDFSSVSSSVVVETTPVEVLDDCADIVGKLMSYAGGSFKAAVVHQDSLALLGILPAPWSEALAAIGMDRVSDISLDLGRRPYCWHDYQRRYLCEDDANHVVEDGHIREIAMGLQNFGDDNRAGIDGQLHRISCIRNNSDGIIGLTIRVGRYVEGNSDMIRDLLEGNNKSILILGEVRALDAAWYLCYCFCAHLIICAEMVADFCSRLEQPGSGESLAPCFRSMDVTSRCVLPLNLSLCFASIDASQERPP
jgi:hypothetical protein